ncbi:MAG TPA: ATP-binding protein, partial [Bacteroidia bacterium]|nr:ATP-binding protein [Bacteroidia bacterium]
PIGEPGDDPFRIDARKVQGYSRFLGTRELIGSIEIWGQSEHFTESSSRDGGLDASVGTAQLEEFFLEGLRRLEKFVQPILWQIRRRTGSEDEEIDIDAKAEIIDLVAKLTGNGEIKLRNFSKDFLNILDEKAEISTPEVFDNLKKIAENAGDQQFRNEIDRSELEFIKIQQARDEQEQLRKEAEEREKKEREKRRAAEQKAKEEEERRKEEEYKRLKAEENERKEAEKRRIAEHDLLKKEKERAEAKLAQLLAEKLAREAAEANKKLSSELDAEKKRSLWQGALLGTDKERIIGLQHQIFHSSSRITRNIGLLLKHLGSGKIDEATKRHIVVMSLEATKINSIANFITKANFNLKATEITTDVVSFVSEYIREVYTGDDKVIDANVAIRISAEEEIEYFKEIRPIEITTLFDNLISNAEKAGAKLVTISFIKKGKKLAIEVANDGKDAIMQEHLERIFEFGFTTTGGTGIGLFQSRDIVKRLGGEIVVTSNDETGTKFTITI